MRKYRYLLIMSLLFIGMAVGCDDEESAPEPTPGDNTGGDALVCKLLNNRAVDRKGGTFFWTVEAVSLGNWNHHLLPGYRWNH